MRFGAWLQARVEEMRELGLGGVFWRKRRVGDGLKKMCIEEFTLCNTYDWSHATKYSESLTPTLLQTFVTFTEKQSAKQRDLTNWCQPKTNSGKTKLKIKTWIKTGLFLHQQLLLDTFIIDNFNGATSLTAWRLAVAWEQAVPHVQAVPMASFDRRPTSRVKLTDCRQSTSYFPLVCCTWLKFPVKLQSTSSHVDASVRFKSTVLTKGRQKPWQCNVLW